MFRSRSHEVVKIMGHDVKQFKSLEGFLESGPQFVLQSYIILRGDKKGIEDFHSVDARKISSTSLTAPKRTIISDYFLGRLAILCITIILSFVSLAKTGYNVKQLFRRVAAALPGEFSRPIFYFKFKVK